MTVMADYLIPSGQKNDAPEPSALLSELQELLDRHERIALCFSGGKDSLACVYLLRPWMDRITIYHLDTGELLPEVYEIIDHVRGFWPRFVRIHGDIEAFRKAHGLATDLLPYSSHFIGRAHGQEKVPLVSRYDCCWANVMWPIMKRIMDDGNTLIIRGTKLADEPKLPADTGSKTHGVELYLPIRGWSHEQVFEYLRSVDAPICRIYDHVVSSPDCVKCTAWWTEERAAYLRRYHPEMYADYVTRLRVVADQIEEPLSHLRRELAGSPATRQSAN